MQAIVQEAGIVQDIFELCNIADFNIKKKSGLNNIKREELFL